MYAELIAVGSELVRFGKADTNSDWLTARLQALGIEVGAKSAVEDDVDRLAATVQGALARAEIVLLTGGLGPTADDRTREALAQALNVALESDPQRLEQLRVLYDRYGRRLDAIEARQAMRPAGSGWIDNPLGSAPGLLVVRQENRLLAALPGVPAEMRAMFEAELQPRLKQIARGLLGCRSLRIVGRTESSLERALGDLYRLPGLELTVLGGFEGVELHVRVRGSEPVEIRRRLDELESTIRQRLGDDVLGSGEGGLVEVVAELLRSSGRSLATAESCTGGLLGGALTAVPGATTWYRGGAVVYADELKVELAGVSRATLSAQGAVSAAVAGELAAGIRERCAADIGIGITGIAGPGGGSEDKPVGLVHLAIDDQGGTLRHELRLIGDREAVRRRTVTVALDRLRRHLLGGT